MEIGKYDEHFAEVFIEQIRQVTNSEVMFEEFAIQAFFNPDDLWDPRILNEEALETSPLGTVSNYRNKYMVSHLFEKLVTYANKYSFPKMKISGCNSELYCLFAEVQSSL